MIPLKKIRPGWWLDAICLAGFVALTVALSFDWFLGQDIAVRDFIDAHRPGWLRGLLVGLNFLGSGTWVAAISLLIALWRVLGPTLREDGKWNPTLRESRAWQRLRSWRVWWPVYPVVAAQVLTVLTIGPAKFFTARHAPRAEGTIGAFFDVPIGITHPTSYPSGHAVNSLVWYAVLVIVAAPWLSAGWRRVLRIVPPVVVTFTTVYLSFHWVTDTIAGLLLGLPLARLIDRVDWPALADSPSSSRSASTSEEGTA